ncbi:MAG: hypothetical protein J3K34DRAFT_127513 [Monoraphidium minutum]|nr:MAG: hypothetical protein J3K34DRAFT_127513 [Monoraphidium minutum]
MGSSSSRLRRQQQLSQQQQGSLPPPPVLPGAFSQAPSAGSGFGQPARPAAAAAATHEYHQTSTVKNQVNLKKASLKLAPVEGRPHDFGLQFTFDATAACRVTTFLLATEEPANACRLRSAVLGAPPRAPVFYPRGMDQKFPPAGDAAAAEAHVISSIHAPLGHMMLASGDSYPLVIRLEALTDEGRKQGRALEELEVGGPFPSWTQAQSTYAKLHQDDDGEWQIAVLKQKIWVNGVSYELQARLGAGAHDRIG